eukprot:gene2796-5503_t
MQSFLNNSQNGRQIRLTNQSVEMVVPALPPASIVSRYYNDVNILPSFQQDCRMPFIPRLRDTIHKYGMSASTPAVKQWIDLVARNSTLSVLIQLNDTTGISFKDFMDDTKELAKRFDHIVIFFKRQISDINHSNYSLSSNSHNHKHFKKSLHIISKQFPISSSICNETAEISLYIISHAAHVKVHQGEYSALAGLIASHGQVYFGKEMNEYTDNPDYIFNIKYPHVLHKPLITDPKPYDNWYNEVLEVIPSCCHFENYGEGDGEKRICVNKSFQKDGCWVMSIGSHGDFSYEESIIKKTKCDVHTFDCTGDWQPPESLRKRVQIHKLCIGNPMLVEKKSNKKVKNKMNFISFSDAVKIGSKSNDNDKNNKILNLPVHVKMDIEGFEFSVIPNILEDKTSLPLQISFEVHLSTNMNPGAPYIDYNNVQVLPNNKPLRDLFDNLRANDYELVSRVDNVFCGTSCTEVVVIHKSCPQF